MAFVSWHRSFVFMTSLAWAMALSSCVTTSTSKPKKSRQSTKVAHRSPSKPAQLPAPDSQEKAGSKAEAMPMPLPQSTKQKRAPYYEDLIAMVARHATVADALNSNERTLVGELPARPDPGSLEEAAVVLAAAKIALESGARAPLPSMENDSTDEPTPATLTVTSSLEEACAAREINLVRAMTTNHFLRTASVHRLLAQALKKGKNSNNFVKEVRTAIKAQAGQWEGLVTDESLMADTGSEAGSPSKAAMISAADLRSGDALLMEAQALANQGRFQDALARVVLIPEDNPLYPQAQERVKAFSNRAVGELRQKAAQAFQSSIPVNDARAKIAYLQQAQGLLEEALNTYPAADHLTTVRENLSVITQDLMDLETQVTP